MSQHQQAFQPDRSDDVSRIALHALAILSSEKEHRAGQQAAALDFAPQLYDAALSSDQHLLRQTVKDIHALGVSNHEIKTILVPAIAQKLGENWLGDIVTFGDVTVGCARLQAVVRHVETRKHAARIHPANRITPRNCLVVVPQGQQHTLGAVVLTDQLRTAGANATLALGVDAATAARMAVSQTFDAVLVSAPAGADIANLKTLVQNLRSNSACAKIFLGGGIAANRSDLAIATGSDYVSTDMREVLAVCRPDGQED